jgi:serine/threonine-protein phosphatase PGAM5
MAKRFLYLIRHGQYAVTPELPQGKLTDLGTRQAIATGLHLIDLPIRRIYTSSMSRAVETAQRVADQFHQVVVEQDDLIKECVPSVPSRLQKQIYEYAKRATDFNLGDIPLHQVQADEAYERYFQPVRFKQDAHELLVCHGNIIRYLLCRVLDAPLDAWANLFVQNCSVSIVRIDERNIKTIMTVNSVEHLPTELRTEM